MRVQLGECPGIVEIFTISLLLASPATFSTHHVVFASEFPAANCLKEVLLVAFRRPVEFLSSIFDVTTVDECCFVVRRD
ncbi:hypothetical protein DU500_17330 (plasmid) [Haloplanus rubicundus]|uniref:Uncharacterized protein n=1 Tax=Haloplanus rubicundus TaxID=1547898 RepID=A0A345E7T1_9EURY|nr:hypothetical protein DU500_17330 [Haloplanus rubicundus]